MTSRTPAENTLIKPFRGLRPKPEFAEAVVAPPYDVLNTEEARIRAKGRPSSFLHISKPEIDLPEGTDPYAAEVYAKGAENLQHLVDNGTLIRDDTPCYYIYRLQMDQHVQTGVVFTSSVADYDVNRVRKHEFTRPKKEDDRVKQITALSAQTGPVLLTYRNSDVVKSIIDKVAAGNPEYQVTADDGIIHTLWVLSDQDLVSKMTETFDAMNAIYIADGHHRSAAASRVAAASDKEGSDYFLSVAFADNEMNILDYNRVIKDLNGLDKDTLLEKISSSFTVTESSEAVRPKCETEFGMYLADSWYKLEINKDLIPADDPVARLDVSLLQDNLISPLLDINDPRKDERIDFVGGIRGLGELEKRVNSGEMAIAFSLYPTTMQALMSVADADEVMPPKSTWFEPKLADGLVSYLLD